MSTPHSTPPDDSAHRSPHESRASGAAEHPAGASGTHGVDTSAPGPVAEDAARGSAANAPEGRRHINPARLEVRVRRLALLGLVLVPVVYFIVQSVR